jgi:hypothetical protein
LRLFLHHPVTRTSFPAAALPKGEAVRKSEVIKASVMHLSKSTTSSLHAGEEALYATLQKTVKVFHARLRLEARSLEFSL